MADLTPTSNTTTSVPVDQMAVNARRLVGFRAFNGAAAAFVQLFDSITSVANGAVPVMTWPVLASTTASIDWPAGFPRSMTTGILLVGSTAAASYASTASVWLFDVQSA